MLPELEESCCVQAAGWWQSSYRGRTRASSSLGREGGGEVQDDGSGGEGGKGTGVWLTRMEEIRTEGLTMGDCPQIFFWFLVFANHTVVHSEWIIHFSFSKIIFGFDCSWCFYPHMSRDSVCPVCGIMYLCITLHIIHAMIIELNPPSKNCLLRSRLPCFIPRKMSLCPPKSYSNGPITSGLPFQSEIKAGHE